MNTTADITVLKKNMKRSNESQNERWKVLVLLLKEIAEAKGITQQQIATETGLLQSNVSRFFSLKYKPGLDIFIQIANAVKVNFFFEDKEGKTDLDVMFEKAMTALHRRNLNLPEN